MRLNAKEQPDLAMNVKAVLLDGKVVPMCFAADEEEGWVESYVPVLPDKSAFVNSDGDGSNLESLADMKIVKRTGKVQIIFNDKPNDD